MRDIDTFTFTGPFKDIIPLMVQHKRAMGYKVAESDLYRLREIDRFFEKSGITEPEITREMYDAWTALREGQRPVTVSRRKSIIRELGRFMLESGYANIYTGADDKRSYESDYVPYIFSKSEILRIFAEMDRICAESPGYINHSFRVIISLCYCCGLRKSEVLSILIRDIDFRSGKISIMHSKGNVSRIIVVSDSLLARLNEYYHMYCTHFPTDSLFIKSPTGGTYPKSCLYGKYHELLKKSGIPERADGRTHRLHDMRHNFSVHALAQMQEKGYDLYTSLPLLSAYLGHKHITETEYYLRLTEEYHDNILKKAADYSPTLFGGGTDDEK